MRVLEVIVQVGGFYDSFRSRKFDKKVWKVYSYK